MATIRLVVAAMLGAGLLAGCGGEPPARFVVIERNEAAFTVFQPGPPGSTEVLLRRMIAESAGDETTRVVAWDGFAAAVPAEISRVVVRQDFPTVKLAPALVCLMTKAPGAWAITWNGSIALTRAEMDAARQSLVSRDAAPVGDPRGRLRDAGCL